MYIYMYIYIYIYIYIHIQDFKARSASPSNLRPCIITWPAACACLLDGQQRYLVKNTAGLGGIFHVVYKHRPLIRIRNSKLQYSIFQPTCRPLAGMSVMRVVLAALRFNEAKRALARTDQGSVGFSNMSKCSVGQAHTEVQIAKTPTPTITAATATTALGNKRKDPQTTACEIAQQSIVPRQIVGTMSDFK